jgi:hypothetical protein
MEEEEPEPYRLKEVTGDWSSTPQAGRPPGDYCDHRRADQPYDRGYAPGGVNVYDWPIRNHCIAPHAMQGPLASLLKPQ